MTYNSDVIERADRVAEAVRGDFLAIDGEGAVILTAAAGAGKSTFISDSVGHFRQQDMRVAVAAPTNEQAFSLVASIAARNPTETVTFVPRRDLDLPRWLERPNVQVRSPAHSASGDAIVVGTISKLVSARHPRRHSIAALGGFDALLVDESYQANAALYYGLADIAPAHLTVGDGGQIAPFAKVEAARQWRGLPEDPLETAVGVLRHHHPETPLHRFPITRRLDSRAVAVVRAFYPADHEFEAAVSDGARELKLVSGIATDSRTQGFDQALDLAATEGWAHLELPASEVLVCDPETIGVIRDLLCRLRERHPTLRCERTPDPAALDQRRVAVGVSHNDQKDRLRAELDAAGLGDVKVDTANKLQGLEFDFLVCWHPLAGLPEADEFHIESGRLCVLMTRHRHACVVVGRKGDRDLVENLAPATDAWPGVEDDAVLDGWEVHRRVFAALEPVRVEL